MSGCCLSTSPRSAGRAGETAVDESAIKSLLLCLYSPRFRRRDVRIDDGAHPPPGSRRSARLVVLGRGVTLACPSASPGACDSDDNSPRIFGGGETSRLH